MKVLQHGQARYIITCPFCECKFMFDELDIQLQMSGDDHKKVWVTCPECNYENKVAPEFLKKSFQPLCRDD